MVVEAGLTLGLLLGAGFGAGAGRGRVDRSAAPVIDSTDSDPSARAQVLSQQAEQEVTAGRHEEASDLLRRAYALDPWRGYLLARGQVERGRGNCRLALELYRTYLDLAASEQEIEFVRPKIRECQQQLSQDDPAGESSPPDPTTDPAPRRDASSVSSAPPDGETPPPGRWSQDRGSLALVSTGSALVVVGAGLYIGAAVTVNRAPTQADERGFQRRIRRTRGLEVAAITSLVAGAAVGLAGLVRHGVMRRRRVTAGLAWAPRGAYVVLVTRFGR